MPTVKLTAKRLDALKPNGDGQVEYFDESLPGFGVRVSPSGRKTFGLSASNLFAVSFTVGISASDCSVWTFVWTEGVLG